MKRNVAFYLFLFLSAIYIALVMLLPADPDVLKRYDLSETEARLLNLSVIVPLTAIWYMALKGFMHFRAYARVIRNSKEGWAFTLLSAGLMVLAFGLPINSIVSALLGFFSYHNPGFLPTATILRNYVTLVIALLTFGLLARGAILLVTSYKKKMVYKPVIPLFMAPIMVVLTSVYTWLIAVRPAESPTDQTGYFLPNWLIIFTLVIPYLAAWFAGLLSIYYLYLYRSNIKGALYKQAFGELARGIGVVTLISVVIQLITTLMSQITRLKLTPILAIIYLLVILYAIGFWYIAKGSKKLQTFEEV